MADDGDTQEAKSLGHRVKMANVTRQKMLWEVKRQSDLGVLRARKDLVMVMMLGLYLKW